LLEICSSIINIVELLLFMFPTNILVSSLY